MKAALVAATLTPAARNQQQGSKAAASHLQVEHHMRVWVASVAHVGLHAQPLAALLPRCCDDAGDVLQAQQRQKKRRVFDALRVSTINRWES
jgi:hypothetical protein